MERMHFYEFSGTKQCWHCANREIEAVRWRWDGILFGLPECKVMQLAMTKVYNNPCQSFVPRYRRRDEQ
jgi:hypothetical protein